MKEKLIFIFSSIAILMALPACNKTSQFEKEEQALIDAYLEKNSSYNFEIKPSGLYYHEIVAGNGRTAIKFDTASVKYTGKFLDGRVFDTNVGTANTLDIVVGASGLIEGFSEGITYMAQGGKSLLLVPSSLGYGSMGAPYAGIYGFTPLLFEVELVLLKAGPGK